MGSLASSGEQALSLSLGQMTWRRGIQGQPLDFLINARSDHNTLLWLAVLMTRHFHLQGKHEGASSWIPALAISGYTFQAGMLLLKLPFPFQHASLKFIVTNRPKHCQINNNQTNIINKKMFTLQHHWPARSREPDVFFTSGKGGFQLSRGSPGSFTSDFSLLFWVQVLILHSGQMPANCTSFHRSKTPPCPSMWKLRRISWA